MSTGVVTVVAMPTWLSAAMTPRPRMKTEAMLASVRAVGQAAQGALR